MLGNSKKVKSKQTTHTYSCTHNPTPPPTHTPQLYFEKIRPLSAESFTWYISIPISCIWIAIISNCIFLFCFVLICCCYCCCCCFLIEGTSHQQICYPFKKNWSFSYFVCKLWIIFKWLIKLRCKENFEILSKNGSQNGHGFWGFCFPSPPPPLQTMGCSHTVCPRKTQPRWMMCPPGTLFWRMLLYINNSNAPTFSYHLPKTWAHLTR